MSLRAGSSPDVGVVVVAAGAGVRAGPGEAKQFRPIRGVPMLLRALRHFLEHPDVCRIVVALPPGTTEQPPAWLAGLVGERLTVVAGGATRADSVRAGLGLLDPPPAVVLVHDAARPFVATTTIAAVIERARAGVGAVAAIPVADTIKDVDDDGKVAHTVSRSRLWRAQTPQGFPGRMLVDAYRLWPHGGAAPTDDAEVVEHAGFAVEVVQGTARNLKVTSEDDWRIAELLAGEEE